MRRPSPVLRWICLAGLLALPVVALASPAGGEGETPTPGMTHRMMTLVIQLGVILFAAKIGSLLFERIHLPGALGELVAGIAIGPYALGHFALPGFPQGLFVSHASQASGFVISPELYALASVAAVVLLFYVGLETDLRLLLKYSVAGGLVGIGGMIASFLFGAGTVMLFSEMLFGEQLGLFAPPCLFLGTITTATSVGITARVLSERRKMDSPEGVTILSAAVIDDVLGIILLAIVMSIVAHGGSGSVDWGHVGLVGGKAVGVWLLGTAVGLLASRRISVVLKWFGERTSIAIMALGIALIVAGLFEEAGLAMIVGAYVMGVSLSRADISNVIQERLSPVYTLLVPVFFCVTGMQIDLGALTNPGVLIFGGVYAVAALSAKLFGCGLPAMLAGFNLRGAARVGFGMAPRCEVALIISGVGLAAGVIGQEILAAVILMIVINTVVAPTALVLLFANNVRGTRKELPGDAAETTSSFELPTLEMAEFFTRKLLDVFEAEGFFVHPVHHQRGLYQLRKDATVLELHRQGAEITFACRQTELALVNTAMLEAVAALEQAISNLREPLDAAEIQSRVAEAFTPGGKRRFQLKDYLTPALVAPQLAGDSKEEVIEELLDLLVRHGRVTDRQAALEAVWTREKSLSTGLQHGVAIPHGKTDTVDRLVCAVGLKKSGVEFGALDGQPCSIFVLTLSPKAKPAPHVQFMSTVSQVLNEPGRRRILGCSTAYEVYQAFTGPLALPASAESRPAAPPAGAPKLDLASTLRADAVSINLKGTTGQEVLFELLTLLESAGQLTNAAEAAEAVLAREEQLSTGMEAGVAVPHARTDAVNHLVCAVGIHREGIDFGALDGQPSRIFVLVLTPSQGADPYLQFVASMVAALDEQGRQKALAAQTPQELVNVLTRGSGRG